MVKSTFVFCTIVFICRFNLTLRRRAGRRERKNNNIPLWPWVITRTDLIFSLFLSVFRVGDRRHACAVPQQRTSCSIQKTANSRKNSTRLVHGQPVHQRDVRVPEIYRQRRACRARRFRWGNVFGSCLLSCVCGWLCDVKDDRLIGCLISRAITAVSHLKHVMEKNSMGAVYSVVTLMIL